MFYEIQPNGFCVIILTDKWNKNTAVKFNIFNLRFIISGYTNAVRRYCICSKRPSTVFTLFQTTDKAQIVTLIQSNKRY